MPKLKSGWQYRKVWVAKIKVFSNVKEFQYFSPVMSNMEGRLLNNRYVIQNQLGKGGFGTTYKALDKQLFNKEVVLKILNENLRNDPNYSKYEERFIKEARVLKELGEKYHNPHIVKILDLFQESGTWYIVMEYIRGKNLWELVKEEGPLSESEALKYFLQIGKALKLVHAEDLVHRDATPMNIMLQEVNNEKQAVLIDFGIVTDMFPSVNTSQHPRNGYFAPDEQEEGETEPTLDIYCLSASLCYAVTRELPKRAKEELNNKNLSDAVKNAILKGMEANPFRRPDSIDEWLELLLGKGQILKERYKITKKLPCVGISEIWEAVDLHIPSHPKCFVKCISGQEKDPDMERRFKQEAEKLSQLGNQHDQIPKLYAYFQEHGEFYLVQEFIEGNDLSREIGDNPWSENSAIDFLKEILDILKFVHENKVIHRDIKPLNIMRRKRDGKLVLIDFGAVKQIITAHTGATNSSTRSIGTVAYMPPEQAVGNPKICSDIYALGMVAIQALIGEYTYNFQLPKDESGEFIWRASAPQVSVQLADILSKMVRDNWRERYQSVEKVLQALQSIDINFAEELPSINTQLQTNFTSPNSDVRVQEINYYLKSFLRTYEYIDDFMGVLDQGKNESQVSLSKLYVEQELDSKNKTFTTVLSSVLGDQNVVKQVIIGEAGIGKTTFLQMLGVRCAHHWSEFQKIPILIKLAEYAYEYIRQTEQGIKYKLTDYITQVIFEKRFNCPILRETLEVDLKEGKYILLLDALDEIGNNKLRKLVADSISDFTYPSNFIVTSRAASYEGDYKIKHVTNTNELQALPPERIKEYVEKWREYIQPSGDEQAENFQKWSNTLLSNPDTEKMLSNPLLLYMTAGYLKRRSDKGESLSAPKKVELYKTVTDHLIKERPETHKSSGITQENIDNSKRFSYLIHIAHWLHENQNEKASQLLIIKQIQKVSPNLSEIQAEEHLAFLVQRIGLLKMSDGNNYTFIHYTFQEFFAAQYYTEKDSGGLSQLFKDVMKNPSKWSTVFANYYALTKDDGALEYLLAERDNIFATRTMLAVDCFITVANEQELNAFSLYNRIFNKLKQLYNSPYELLQKEAWHKLKKVGGSSLLTLIGNELFSNSNSNSTSYQNYIEALGEMATEPAVDLLADTAREYLGEDGHQRRILSIIKALIKVNTIYANSKIAEILNDAIGYENEYLTQSILCELRITEKLEYINIILEVLQANTDAEWLQEASLKELGQSSLPTVQEMFSQLLLSSNSQSLKEVELLLNVIKFPAAENIRSKVISLLNSQESRLVIAATRFFKNQNETSISNKLLELLYDFESENLQIEILKTLGHILKGVASTGDAETLISDYIYEYNSSPKIIEYGINALGEFGGQISFKFLSGKLQDLNQSSDCQEIKTSVIVALYKINKRNSTNIKPDSHLCDSVINFLITTQVEEEILARAAVFLLFQSQLNKKITILLDIALTIPENEQNSLQNKILQQYITEELLNFFLKKDGRPLSQTTIAKWAESVRDNSTDDELVASASKLRLKLRPQPKLQEYLQSGRDATCLVALDAVRNDNQLDSGELLLILQNILHSSSNGEVIKKTLELLGEKYNVVDVNDSLITSLEHFLNNDEYRQKAFVALRTIAERNGLLGNELFLNSKFQTQIN